MGSVSDDAYPNCKSLSNILTVFNFEVLLLATLSTYFRSKLVNSYSTCQKIIAKADIKGKG